MSSSNKALREANKRLYEAFQAWAKEVGLSPNIPDGDAVKQHFVSEEGVSHPFTGGSISCTHPMEHVHLSTPERDGVISRSNSCGRVHLGECLKQIHTLGPYPPDSLGESTSAAQAKHGYLHSDGITLLTPCEPTDNQAALHYLKNGRWHRVHYQFVDGERSRFIRMYLGGEIVRVYLTEAMPDDFGYFFDPLRPYTPIDYKDRTRTRMPNLSDDGAVLMGRGVDGLWYNARKAFPEEDDTNAYCLYKDDPNDLVGVVPADKIRAFVDID